MAIAIQQWSRSQARQARYPRISVVIPAMNEARNLPYVLPDIPVWVAEVILVDGDSVDDTVAVARRLLPSIKVVPQEGRGKGAALRTGFAAATGDIIVMLDADGSTPATEIERFVDVLLSGADFAKGTRYLPGGGSADITRFRSLGNRVFSGLVNTLFGAEYTDLCYGYNAFWSSCLPFLHVDCDGFEVETQITIRATQAGLQVCEVPSFEGKRIHGVSNLHAFRDGWRVLQMILRERCRPQARARRTGPPQWEMLPGEVGDAGLRTRIG